MAKKAGTRAAMVSITTWPAGGTTWRKRASSNWNITIAPQACRWSSNRGWPAYGAPANVPSARQPAPQPPVHRRAAEEVEVIDAAADPDMRRRNMQFAGRLGVTAQGAGQRHQSVAQPVTL